MYANAQRIETRYAHRFLRAFRDATQTTVPLEYYRALYDTPEEAVAMYNLHASRHAAANAARISESDG